jgi:hypothetical protein
MMSEFKKQVLTQIGALLTAAFGLIAALAWNGAIQAIFKQVFGTADSLVPMLIYAIVVTIIAVIAMVVIGKMISKNQ